MLIVNGVLVEPFETPVTDAAVRIEDGVVTYAGPRSSLPARKRAGADEPVLDAMGDYVAPGFLDIHVHGGGGFDTMDASVDSLAAMTRAHARAGTTSLLPTTVTGPREQLIRAERAVVEAVCEQRRAARADGQDPAATRWGARLAGIHLEGPFLNPERKGAQNPRYIRDATVAELEELWEASRAAGEPLLRVMTVAPERPGGLEAVRWLNARGISASVGHSGASEDEFTAAVDAGAGQVTHLFNGMSPFHHRHPGLAGAALADGRVVTQLVGDGLHVHPTAARVAYLAKGARRIALITDALAPMGLGDGRFRLGELDVVVKEGACYLLDGTLAGSIIGLGDAVRHMARWTGAPLPDVVAMAGYVPALSVGLGDRAGRLRPGYWGDVTVLSRQSLDVRATVVGGRVCFQNT